MSEYNLGWIKLWRKLEDNPVFKNPRLLQLWIYCLFKANHKENKAMVGYQEVKLEPGQFITGRYSLAEALGLKPRSARSSWNWLKILEKMQFLTIKSTNKYSIVSVNNWHSYQGQENDNFQQDYQPDTIKIPSKYHQNTTDKNVKNVKNVKNNNVQLSNLLKTMILQNNPKAKITDTQIKNWGNTIRLMIERDKRTIEEIESLIKFSQNDDFWKSNILSMDKLRKQFDRLTLQAKQKEPKKEPEIIQKPELMSQLTPEQIEDNKKRLAKLIDSLN